MIAVAAGFGFAAPAWLWALALLPVLLGWRWRRRARVRFAGGSWFATPMPATLRSRAAPAATACELVALAALVLALAEPIEQVPIPAPPPGRDLLLCLDVSSSMAANDLHAAQNRLQVGIGAAQAFVRARPNDRIGALAFARYADVRCPLTRDHEALAELLGGLRLVQKEGPEDATAIGGAVARAAACLQRARGKGRVIVVVTDGEENVASALAPEEIAPLHAAQLCAERGIRVHAIVVGRGNQRADGRFVALDTTAVRQLATTTGGRFFTAEDAAALASVYAAIDALEADAAPPPGVQTIARFPYAVWSALLAHGLAVLLRATWLRRLP